MPRHLFELLSHELRSTSTCLSVGIEFRFKFLIISVLTQMNPSGWSEGECKGKAGWFPSAYVEKRQRLPTTNVAAEVYWDFPTLFILWLFGNMNVWPEFQAQKQVSLLVSVYSFFVYFPLSLRNWKTVPSWNQDETLLLGLSVTFKMD